MDVYLFWSNVYCSQLYYRLTLEVRYTECALFVLM